MICIGAFFFFTEGIKGNRCRFPLISSVFLNKQSKNPFNLFRVRLCSLRAHARAYARARAGIHFLWVRSPAFSGIFEIPRGGTPKSLFFNSDCECFGFTRDPLSVFSENIPLFYLRVGFWRFNLCCFLRARVRAIACAREGWFLGARSPAFSGVFGSEN